MKREKIEREKQVEEVLRVFLCCYV